MAGNLDAELIDGTPRKDFVTRDNVDSITIDGQKNFSHVRMEDSFKLADRINGVDLSHVWNDSLRLNGDQTLNYPLIVDNDLTANRITAAKVPFTPLNDVGTLIGTKHFPTLIIKGDWRADAMNVDGSIDGIDIHSWPSDTLFRNGNCYFLMKNSIELV